MEMTEVQKERLGKLSGEVLRTLNDLFLAQIDQEKDRTGKLTLRYARAEGAYSRALTLLGFVEGDRVRVKTRGSFEDQVGVIEQTYDRSLVLLLDDIRAHAKPDEVEMVEPVKEQHP